MNDKQLTILIDGREALPVRAIPHVTKWIRFYPDKLANHFARDDCVSPIARGRLLIDAYHLSGNAPVQVMPSEWDAVIASLDGFEAETWKQYGRDNLGEKIGYAAWRNGATAKLPEGVFVWLDEFEKVFQADVKCTGSYDKPGDDKLTLAPMLDATTRAMVMAGFETLPTATGGSSDAAAKVETGAGTTPAPADEIPGKIPNTTNCKLAIKAAWQIECETSKRATAKQVIEKLQTWVDHKDNTEAVTELTGKIPNGVKWVTCAGKENQYDIGACQKTLETWNKSRT